MSPRCSAATRSAREKNIMSHNENTLAASNPSVLEALTKEVGAFLTFLAAEETTLNEMSVRRFTWQALLEGDAGYRSEAHNAIIAHGDLTPFGNLGGSFYVFYGEGNIGELPYGQLLRLRWYGDNALYWNDSDNYVRYTLNLAEDGTITVELFPERVNGRRVRPTTEDYQADDVVAMCEGMREGIRLARAAMEELKESLKSLK
jgi:hypothetical protein